MIDGKPTNLEHECNEEINRWLLNEDEPQMKKKQKLDKDNMLKEQKN